MESMPNVFVDQEMCKGCLICRVFCPSKVFDIVEEVNRLGAYPVKPVRLEKCIACMLCELYCPDQAVYVEA